MESKRLDRMEAMRTELEVAIARQFLNGILPHLPFRTGKTSDVLQAQAFASYKRALLTQVRSSTFIHGLKILFELMTQVMDETGWRVVGRHEALDFRSVETTCNPDEDLSLIAESLNILCQLCEHGLALHVAFQLGLDTSGGLDELSQDFTVEQLIRETLEKTSSPPPPLDREVAIIGVRTLMRACPPTMIKAMSTLDTGPSMNLLDNQQLLLWQSTFHLMVSIVFLNYETSFRGMEERVFNATFKARPGKVVFNPDLRPELLVAYYFSPSNVTIKYQKALQNLTTALPDAHLEMLATFYARSIDLYILYTGKTQDTKYNGVLKLRQIYNQLNAFISNKSTLTSTKDHALHLFATKLGLLCGIDGHWWETSDKITPGPSWKKYFNLYRSKLTSHDKTDFLRAYHYLTTIVKFACLDNNAAGHETGQGEALATLARSIFPNLKDASARVVRDMATNNVRTMGSLSLFIFHGAYAEIYQDEYFKTYFMDSNNFNAFNMLVAFVTSRRIYAQADGRSTSLEYNSAILHCISACSKRSHQSRPDKEVYAIAFKAGLAYLRGSTCRVQMLSKESILEFCEVIIKTLSCESHDVCDSAISSFVHLIMYSNSESFATLSETHFFLCSLLQGCEKVLQGPSNGIISDSDWNLVFVRGILEARLHVSEKLLAIDPSRYVIDGNLEGKLRAALIVSLCSADKDLAGEAFECLRLINDEIELWIKAKLPFDDVMQDALFLKSSWSVIAKAGKSYLGHSFMIRNLVQKIYNANPHPVITDCTVQTVEAGLSHWKIVCEDVNGKLPTIFRKSAVNLMLFLGTTCSTMATSYIDRYRELAFAQTDALARGIASPYPAVREINLVVTRSCILPTPEFAGNVIQIACSFGLGSLLEKQDSQSIRDPRRLEVVSAFVSQMVRLVTVAAEAKEPPQYDIGAYIRVLFKKCSDFFPTESITLSEPFFNLLIVTAEHDNLLLSSKFDVFNEVVTIIFEQLAQFPNHKCIKYIANALPAVLEDHTLYASSSASSFSLLDSRYTAFKEMFIIMSKYIGKNEYVDEHHAKLFEEAIIRFSLANQEMAVVFFEETTTVMNPKLRACLYESFSSAFLEENHDPTNSKYEDIVNLLLKDVAIIEGMCEICPYSEGRDLAVDIATFICEYGKGLKLAKWAFGRDLDHAHSAEELLRKNTVNVQILLHIINIYLKRRLHAGLRGIICKVYARPYVFMGINNEGTQEAKEGEEIVLSAIKEIFESKRDNFSDTVLPILKVISERVEEKFPGRTNLVLRNLFFLRIICPMIVLPHNFGLVMHAPEGAVHDGLIQLAKYLQGFDFEKPNESSSKKCSLYVLESYSTLTEQTTTEGSFGAELNENLIPADSLALSFYNLHKFFYRHNRELHAYLYAHSVAPRRFSDATSIGGAPSIGPVPGSPLSIGSISSGSSRPTLQSALYTSSVTSCRYTVASDEFVKLLIKLGRPSVGFYNQRTERQPSNRSSIRKASLVQWHESDRRFLSVSYYENTTFILLSSAGRMAEEKYDAAAFAKDITRVVDQVRRDREDQPVEVFGDNTWWDIGVDETMAKLTETVEDVFPKMDMTFTRSSHLNVSFDYFQQFSALPHKIVDRFSQSSRYITSLDVDADYLDSLGVSEETMLAVRDIEKAEKFENVSLQFAGSAYKFTVYVGKQFIQVLSDVGSCDVFNTDAIRFINGSMYLKKQCGKFDTEFTLVLGENSDLHKTLWTVFHRTRRSNQLTTPKPLLELSVAKFYTYLLCNCLLDLCSPSEDMRRSANDLLPSIIKRFELDVPDLDISLHTSSIQLEKVVEISTRLAEHHDSLVIDVILCFISIASRQRLVNYCGVQLIKPWFNRIKQALTVEGSTRRLEVIIRSMISIKEILDGEDTESALLLEQHIWPVLLHEGIAELSFDVYISCASFRLQVLKEDIHSMVFAVPISTKFLKKIYTTAFALLSEGAPKSEKDSLRWSGVSTWNRIHLSLLVYCLCVFNGAKQIQEVLSETLIIIFIFGGIGPLSLRKGIFHLMNVIVNQFVAKGNLSVASHDMLLKLRREINSDRALLLFGVQDSGTGDNYDDFDVQPFDDAHKIASYLTDFCSAIMPLNSLKRLREDVLKKLMDILKIDVLASRRKASFGLVAFTSHNLPSSISTIQADYCISCISQNPDERHFMAVIECYQLHCEKMLVWLDDKFIMNYIWVGLGLCGLGFGPIYLSSIRLLNAALRTCQIRGLTQSKPLTELLTESCPPAFQAWWNENSKDLTEYPDPAGYFAAEVSGTIIPLMYDSSIRQEALDACENWLTAFQGDPNVCSLVEFSLVFYVFSRKSTVVDKVNIFGILLDFNSDDEMEERIQEKIALNLSKDLVSGLAAIINVCQILSQDLSLSACLKFFAIIVKMTNMRLLVKIQPLLWPICLKVIPLLESEHSHLALSWAENIGMAAGNSVDDWSIYLDRIHEELGMTSRRKAVNDNYEIQYHTVKTEYNQRISELCTGLLKSLYL